MVQGVGFRPHVCRLAHDLNLHGTVSNGNDGVHIYFNAKDEAEARKISDAIVQNPPPNAIISGHILSETESCLFEKFEIIKSSSATAPNLLLTPDIAICNDCRHDVYAAHNRRHGYAFTTCLQCGPRYSIITSLPYDRENTTMDWLHQCPACEKEYNDIYNRRHYSQTNSCPHCRVPLELFNNDGEKITDDASLVIKFTIDSLREGKIIAVKGIGGYLLICDATNDYALKNLRERKHRPGKPFAVMYASAGEASKDVVLSSAAISLLQGKVSPVVLCPMKDGFSSGIVKDLIAPGLDKLGVMLPYTALLQIIADKFSKPLIATSGNLSGSPIIYKDEDALLWLCDYADYVLGFRRDIVTPQDDSVVQLTKDGRQIILRRSRGIAPTFYPNPFKASQSLLAMGAELKSAFALLDKNNLYISQFLGDQKSFESQESFKYMLKHLSHLLHIVPEVLLVDKHPAYHVSELGRKIAEAQSLTLIEVQHHIAHFCAVLQENDLMQSKEPVLGIVWDGTGFGDDKQIWGGEFFTFANKNFSRVAQLEYFPLLSGDKMAKEPRVSAVSLLRKSMSHLMMLKDQFNERERLYYLKLIEHNQAIQTSSMGRLLDGIAAILGLQHINTYEGEAAMKLEVAARNCTDTITGYYTVSVIEGKLLWQQMVYEIAYDKKAGISVSYIAKKVFVTLVKAIEIIAESCSTKKLAFSGGVFQNALLIEIIAEKLSPAYELFFHKKLSPNDECISFGQIAWYLYQKENDLL